MDWLVQLWKLRVPGSAICKLEAHESWCCGSSPSSKVGKLGNQCCQSRTKFDGLRTGSADVKGQEKLYVLAQPETANSFFLHLLVRLRHSRDWIMPVLLVKDICFIQSTDSNTNLLQKTLHRHAQK